MSLLLRKLTRITRAVTVTSQCKFKKGNRELKLDPDFLSSLTGYNFLYFLDFRKQMVTFCFTDKDYCTHIFLLSLHFNELKQGDVKSFLRTHGLNHVLQKTKGKQRLSIQH